MTRLTTGLACLTVIAAAGCSHRGLSGPPQLRLGRDECAGCGMLIEEDRSSCGVLVERDGVREHLVFDDLGCLLDYQREPHPGQTVIERFLHDHDSGAWIPAAAAWCVAADPKTLRTPMGSGLAAFGSQQAAQQFQKSSGGDVVSLEAAAALRRGRADGRGGGPGGGS